MNLLDSKLKRLLPPTKKEKEGCSTEIAIMKDRREWMKQNIIERLVSVDDGLVIQVKMNIPKPVFPPLRSTKNMDTV